MLLSRLQSLIGGIYDVSVAHDVYDFLVTDRGRLPAAARGGTAERHRNLQRLGDVSLFVAGFFAQGFATRLIDIDYHIAMGGRAYGALAQATARGRGRVLAAVFAELSAKFQPMVDALNEVSESSCAQTDRDILRLYEIWLKTGSPRCYAQLKRLGVDPTGAGGTTCTH